MTLYNVHIYRELRLRFDGVEAETPEEAARLARDRGKEDAAFVDECDGETFAALVDVAGDEDYAHSRCIDFEGGRLLRAARPLREALEAVRAALRFYPHWKDSMPGHLIAVADAALAKANGTDA